MRRRKSGAEIVSLLNKSIDGAKEDIQALIKAGTLNDYQHETIALNTITVMRHTSRVLSGILRDVPAPQRPARTRRATAAAEPGQSE